MKRFIVFIITAIILAVGTSFTAKGQDRINGEKYSFDKESGKVSAFIGWYYSRTTEQWVDNENCISNTKIYHSVGTLAEGNKTRNLQWIQVKTFFYNDEKFYVLDVVKNGGVYLYPSIKEDWVSMKEHCLFIISKDEYEEIVTPSEEVKEYFCPCVENTTISDSNELIRKLSKTNKKFNEEESNEIKGILYGKKFAIKKYKDCVRFLYDDSYGEWLYIGEWDKEDKFTKRKPLNSLSEVYFETSLSDWENLKI